jgi:hypothetical protein
MTDIAIAVARRIRPYTRWYDWILLCLAFWFGVWSLFHG